MCRAVGGGLAGFARHRTGSVVAGGAEDMQVFALEQIELTDIEERGDRSGGKPFGGWGILRRPCGLRTKAIITVKGKTSSRTFPVTFFGVPK